MSTMISFGGIRFALTTAAYQSKQHAVEARWQSQERFGGEPALHYTGQNSEKLELEGVIYPHFTGTAAVLEALRELAVSGKPYLLIEGNGTIRGEWVLESVEQTGEHFLNNGTPRKITFRMRLSKYGA